MWDPGVRHDRIPLSWAMAMCIMLYGLSVRSNGHFQGVYARSVVVLAVTDLIIDQLLCNVRASYQSARLYGTIPYGQLSLGASCAVASHAASIVPPVCNIILPYDVKECRMAAAFADGADKIAGGKF